MVDGTCNITLTSESYNTSSKIRAAVAVEVMVAGSVNLTEAVLERQRLNAQHLHFLDLFFVEELHLVHGDDSVAVEVHAAEPVLNATHNTATKCIAAHHQPDRMNNSWLGLDSGSSTAGLTTLHIYDM